jgi:curved DNA-binding protein CbpA
MADYYKRLNISKNASEEEIKKAYRQQAMKLHPDKGGNHTDMRKLNKIYKTLTDPKKRKRYNQTLEGKRYKVVEIRKPPYKPWAETARPATRATWSGKTERKKVRPTNPAKDIKWRPAKRQKYSVDMYQQGVNTKALREAQQSLAAIKDDMPILTQEIDAAYLQIGQILQILRRVK